MRQARVTVLDSDGEALGVSDLVETVKSAGLVDVEVLSCEGVRGVVRVEVEEAADEDRLRESSSVVWLERVAGTESGRAYVLEFEAEEAPDPEGACAGDLLTCRVEDVTDEGFTFELAGPHEAISETVAAYERTDATVTLDSIGEYESPGRPLDSLTARQREVLRTAYDMGYFDVPRAATTDEVAAALELDDSTVAEHLQRAARNLVSSTVAGTT